MPQKNETPALILAFLITAGLIGGGFWWFRQQGTGSSPSGDAKSASSNAPINPAASSSAITNADGAKQPTLASDRNVDYSQLQADLQKKDWKAADR